MKNQSGENGAMEATHSILVQTFGETPYLKALDYFLMQPGVDYSKAEVARETGVARATLDGVWEKLVDEGFIRKTRRVGRAELYALNTANERVKAMVRIDFNLAKAYAEEIHQTKRVLHAYPTR